MPSYGWDGTLTEGVEANKLYRGMEGAYRHVVWSGGDVTPGTGRAVSVSAIDGVIAGAVWFTESAAVSVALDANATANPRIDYIVAQADWSTNAVTITKVTGTAAATPVAPGLTQTPGATWQMPLARVRVAAGATTVPTTAIEPCKPGPRVDALFRGAVAPDSMRGSATGWNTISTVSVPDPGWPYRLQVSATARINAVTGGGFVLLRVSDIDTNTNYGHGISSWVSQKAPANLTTQVSNVLTGTRRVRLEMSPADMAASETFNVIDHSSNHFTVVRTPA